MSSESENNIEMWTMPVKNKGNSYGMIVAITLCLLITIAAVGITVAILEREPEKSYSAVMTDVKVLLSLDTYEVDYGQDGQRLNYDVYWDDDNTGEFEAGSLCSSWDRYQNSDANRQQSVGKVCRIEIDDLNHQVGITACLYHEDEKYDIYSGDSDYGSCVLWQDIDVNPSMGWQLCAGVSLNNIDTGWSTSKSTSGLDDSDENQYNGRIEFSYKLEYTYDCVES